MTVFVLLLLQGLKIWNRFKGSVGQNCRWYGESYLKYIYQAVDGLPPSSLAGRSVRGLGSGAGLRSRLRLKVEYEEDGADVLNV